MRDRSAVFEGEARRAARSGRGPNHCPKAGPKRISLRRPLMVDGLRRNGQDGERGEHGKERHEEEDGALRQSPSDEAGEGRDGDIAGMVEGGIASHAPRQLLARDKA